MAAITQQVEVTIDNPYVGPRTFRSDEADLFFGREREARDLISLIIAKRLVLFYAQSGAGKSSLLNTRIDPGLRTEGFEVLPIGGVRGASGLEVRADNIYVYNLMLSLHQGTLIPTGFETLSLSDFLDNLVFSSGRFIYDPQHQYAADEPLKPRILLIDQFEDILTTNSACWEHRSGFFEQLANALELDAHLWIVLTMREDFVAALEPFLHHLPGRLSDRYRMDRLNREAALEAIRNPAAKARRPFVAGAAEVLVDNLGRIQVPEQENGTLLGEFVEPVQLQTVCFQMWESLRSQPGNRITDKNVRDYADVDRALAQFYEATVSETVAHTGVSEIDLRDWFERDLITEAGTRGIVYRGDEVTGRLPTSVADFVNTKFMLRTEARAGGAWYELVHDRFIQPILIANGEWRLKQPLIQLAQEWKDAGRREESLLTGSLLATYLDTNWHALGPLVTEFMEASYAVHKRQEEALGKERDEAQQRELRQALELAEAQRLRAEEQAEATKRMRRRAQIILGVGILALIFGGTAIYYVLLANQNAKLAAAERAAAQEQSALAQSDQLANTATLLLNVEPQSAILAALLAEQKVDTPLAQEALQTAARAARLRSYLAGHTGSVSDLAYNADGTLLASAGSDGTVRVWDVFRAAPVYTITNPSSRAVLSVAFDPLGERLAWGDSDGHLYLGPFALQDEVFGNGAGRSPAHNKGIRDLAFSPDGTLLASAGQDAQVLMWNGASGEPIMAVQKCDTSDAPDVCIDGEIISIAFSPDGALLAAAGQDSSAYVWDLASGILLGRLLGHTGDIRGVDDIRGIAFSPDGKWLATAGSDNVAMLWDAQSLHAADRLPAHTNWLLGVAFSPDSRRLATSSWDGSVKIWDVQSGREMVSLVGHNGAVTALAYGPASEDSIATGSQDGIVRVWNAASDPAVALDGVHAGGVTGIAYRPDGMMLATVGNDGMLRLWDVITGTLMWTQGQVGSGRLLGVAFSPDGKRLVTAGEERAAVIRDASNGEEILALVGHGSTVYAAVFSPDGERVATVGFDGIGRIFDARSANLLVKLEGSPSELIDVAFSPDGALIATVGDDGIVRLWDAATGSKYRSLDDGAESGFGAVTGLDAVAFSPDGEIVAAAGRGRSILTWSVADGHLIGRQSSAHVDRIRDLAYSPDGRWLASASWDVTAKLWPFGLGTAWRTLTGHTDRVTALAFRPDSRQIATGGNDGRVLFTLIDSQDLVELARSRLVRPLTDQECAQYVELGVCP